MFQELSLRHFWGIFSLPHVMNKLPTPRLCYRFILISTLGLERSMTYCSEIYLNLQVWEQKLPSLFTIVHAKKSLILYDSFIVILVILSRKWTGKTSFSCIVLVFGNGVRESVVLTFGLSKLQRLFYLIKFP